MQTLASDRQRVGRQFKREPHDASHHGPCLGFLWILSLISGVPLIPLVLGLLLLDLGFFGLVDPIVWVRSDLDFFGRLQNFEVQRLQKKVDQDWEGSTVVVSATDQVRGREPSTMNLLLTTCSLAATCNQSWDRIKGFGASCCRDQAVSKFVDYISIAAICAKQTLVESYFVLFLSFGGDIRLRLRLLVPEICLRGVSSVVVLLYFLGDK